MEFKIGDMVSYFVRFPHSGDPKFIVGTIQNKKWNILYSEPKYKIKSLDGEEFEVRGGYEIKRIQDTDPGIIVAYKLAM
jgi:hypothetical protein